ncbi:MAG TPA: peptidylprolyl isomerase [Polyangiales bacterium]|nr:peptidylprolyl isomerase [Polyangiales bacterium]
MSSLFVSAAQILVTHQESQPAGFLHHVHPASRTKAQAAALAQSLRSELKRDPSRFAALAASSSDDRVSAEIGGELGAFRAVSVMQPIADALGYLEVGEISRVVETEVGFHILKRLPMPQDERFSFSRIVIKHEQSNGWKRADRPVVPHTREEARALAELIAAELAREPARFVELAREHSESDDVSRDGDAGEYSRYEELGADFVMMERIRQLPVAQVSRVYETAMGFEIAQRTAPAVREELAANIITLPYQGSQIERYMPVRRTRARAKSAAERVLRELERQPELFAERRLEYCDAIYCNAVVAWQRGRELPELERVVGALSVGQLAAEPIDTPLGFLVARREDPRAVPKQQASPIVDYRAVQPSEPAASLREPPDLKAEVQELGRSALPQLKLPPEREHQFVQLFAEFDQRAQAEDPARPNLGQHLSWLDERLQALLGEDSYDEFDRHRRRWMASHAP